MTVVDTLEFCIHGNPSAGTAQSVSGSQDALTTAFFDIADPQRREIIESLTTEESIFGSFTPKDIFWAMVRAMKSAESLGGRKAAAQIAAACIAELPIAPSPPAEDLSGPLSEVCRDFIQKFPSELGMTVIQDIPAEDDSDDEVIIGINGDGSPPPLKGFHLIREDVFVTVASDDGESTEKKWKWVYSPLRTATWSDLKPFHRVHLVQHLHELPEEAFALITDAMTKFRQNLDDEIEAKVDFPKWKPGHKKFDLLLRLSTKAWRNLARGPEMSFQLCQRDGLPTFITDNPRLCDLSDTISLTIWRKLDDNTLTFGTGFVGELNTAPTLARQLSNLAKSGAYDDKLMQKTLDEYEFLSHVSDRMVYGLYVPSE